MTEELGGCLALFTFGRDDCTVGFAKVNAARNPVIERITDKEHDCLNPRFSD